MLQFWDYIHMYRNYLHRRLWIFFLSRYLRLVNCMWCHTYVTVEVALKILYDNASQFKTAHYSNSTWSLKDFLTIAKLPGRPGHLVLYYCNLPRCSHLMITLARSLQSEWFLRPPPRGGYLERIQRGLFFGRRVDPDVTASLETCEQATHMPDVWTLEVYNIWTAESKWVYTIQ